MWEFRPRKITSACSCVPRMDQCRSDRENGWRILRNRFGLITIAATMILFCHLRLLIPSRSFLPSVDFQVLDVNDPQHLSLALGVFLPSSDLLHSFPFSDVSRWIREVWVSLLISIVCSAPLTRLLHRIADLQRIGDRWDVEVIHKVYQRALQLEINRKKEAKKKEEGDSHRQRSGEEEEEAAALDLHRLWGLEGGEDSLATAEPPNALINSVEAAFHQSEVELESPEIPSDAFHLHPHHWPHCLQGSPTSISVPNSSSSHTPDIDIERPLPTSPLPCPHFTALPSVAVRPSLDCPPLSASACGVLLRSFLVAHTLKDCSLLVQCGRLREAEEEMVDKGGTSSLFPSLSSPSPSSFVFCVPLPPSPPIPTFPAFPPLQGRGRLSVVDLDIKAVEDIPYYAQLDEDIVRAYEEAITWRRQEQKDRDRARSAEGL